MSVTASEQQERGKDVKISNTDVNRSVSGLTKVTRIDLRSKVLASHPSIPSNPSLPSSSPLRRSYKLKPIKEQNNVTNSDTANKLSSEAVWKNSKLFSKTLSTIDGVHLVRKTNSVPMTTISQEYGSSKTNCSANIDTNIGNANKSTIASSTSVPAAKVSEWKLLKNKLSLLRKKSNSKEISGICNNNAIVAKDIKVVNTSADSFISKHEKSPQASRAHRSISPSESILAKKGSSQEKGIVCKKEDLMHIISEASKGVKVTKTKQSDDNGKQRISPTTSTDVSIKRNALKKQHSCGSQSSDKEENSTTKQSNTRIHRSNSCEGEKHNKNQYIERDNGTEKSENDMFFENESKVNQNELDMKLWKQNKTISDERISTTEANCPFRENEIKVDNEEVSEEEIEEASGAVQWDDINFVDPFLLGDAIETFLRDLGSTGVANSTNEKRVSFKKSF